MQQAAGQCVCIEVRAPSFYCLSWCVTVAYILLKLCTLYSYIFTVSSFFCLSTFPNLYFRSISLFYSWYCMVLLLLTSCSRGVTVPTVRGAQTAGSGTRADAAAVP